MDDSHSTEARLSYVLDRLDELLEHTEALVFWAIDQAKKHDLSTDALTHHVARIRVILSEVRAPPSEKVVAKIRASDDSYHDKDPATSYQNLSPACLYQSTPVTKMFRAHSCR